ncbi:MAG: ribose-phosphate pyrophosphokinase [Nanoarchaeota archaeon]|nr:ribose-phosphate pyrophosphokinase [Nanoarchaeota archaeon]
MAEDMVLIAGSANPELAEEISKKLDIALHPLEVKQFSDGEKYVRIGKSVRGTRVFVIQPTSPPTNDTLMELLLIIDALKRSSAKEINVVVPYFGYSRQDRKTLPREPISARVVANMIEMAGAHRVITFDLHADQIQGFFDIPVDNLETTLLFADFLLDKKKKDVVVVAPDVGGAKRARRLARELGAPIAIIDKRRMGHAEAEAINIIGEVEGKFAILIDDMIDTAGTISSAAEALKKAGAKEACIIATHALFSGDAIEKLDQDFISMVGVTNSVAIAKEKRFKKLEIISIAEILAGSIKKIYEGTSMGEFFEALQEKIEKKK